MLIKMKIGNGRNRFFWLIHCFQTDVHLRSYVYQDQSLPTVTWIISIVRPQVQQPYWHWVNFPYYGALQHDRPHLSALTHLRRSEPSPPLSLISVKDRNVHVRVVQVSCLTPSFCILIIHIKAHFNSHYIKWQTKKSRNKRGGGSSKHRSSQQTHFVYTFCIYM